MSNTNDHEKNIPTLVHGAGQILTEAKINYLQNGCYGFNFLVRTDDSNILRLQFWDDSIESFQSRIGRSNPKGLRVRFNGRLSGVYQEKGTVTTSLESVDFV